MLDINFIRENPALIKKAVRDKRMNVDIDRLLLLDGELRALVAQTDTLRRDRNMLSKQSARMDGAPEERERVSALVRSCKEQLGTAEAVLSQTRAEYEQLLLTVPSVPAPEVPVGADERDNEEVRRWGEPPVFDFEPKDHLALAEVLDIVDIARAVRIAGGRSYYLKNEGVLLEQAVCRFALDHLISKGFTPMSVPLMVREEAMRGTGYFPLGRDQAYSLPEDDLFLIGTSEVALVSCHAGELLAPESLPIRYAGISTCFRREAGTYGRDTRGLYRVHQFQKVEQVVFCLPDDGEALRLHAEILGNTEEIMRALGLPYRIMLACTGEIGIGQVRKNEVEAWMPSRGAYCETHSCSTMGDFQARRLNIRCRMPGGGLRYVYTLNNTGIASPRILIPLLENNQNADGSVRIPDVLVPYMNGRTLLKPKQ